MKFKENAIKKGMIIHCPKEEDAEALLKYLKELGYFWCNGHRIDNNNTRYEEYKENTCYGIGCCGNKKIAFCELSSASEHGRSITEFSDLLEPVETSTDLSENKQSEMTAVEIVNWLAKNYYNGEIMTEVFNDDSCLDELGEKLGAQGIIDKITAYEAAKKASKPVEAEWVDVCRIIKVKADGTKKCVYEEDIPDDNEEELYIIGKDILKKYASEHDGEYIAVMESVCRVKKEENAVGISSN